MDTKTCMSDPRNRPPSPFEERSLPPQHYDFSKSGTIFTNTPQELRPNNTLCALESIEVIAIEPSDKPEELIALARKAFEQDSKKICDWTAPNHSGANEIKSIK